MTKLTSVVILLFLAQKLYPQEIIEKSNKVALRMKGNTILGDVMNSDLNLIFQVSNTGLAKDNQK